MELSETNGRSRIRGHGKAPLRLTDTVANIVTKLNRKNYIPILISLKKSCGESNNKSK